MSFCAVSNEVRDGWEMFFVMFSLVPQSMLIWNQTILPRGVLQQLFSSSFTLMFRGETTYVHFKVKFCSFTTIKRTNTQLYRSHFITIGLLNSDYNQWPSWCIFATWIPWNSCLFCQLAIIYLFGRFCLDKLWVDPVGRGDHLWDRFDFFVLLTGEPKQYVLLAVLGLQELPEGYLSGWKSQMTVSR